jgi:hypothetical protein
MDDRIVLMHASNVADSTLLYLVTISVPYGSEYIEMSTKGLSKYVVAPVGDGGAASDGSHSATTFDLLRQVVANLLAKADSRYPGIKAVDQETVVVRNFQVFPNDIRSLLGR